MSPSRRVVLALAGVSVLSLVLGFLAATIIKSPAQIAAETSPPPLSMITAKVETGTIEKVLLFTGEVTLGNKVALSPPGPSGVEPLVTKVPLEPGSPVEPGTVLLEIADRPIILLAGDIPLLRDLQRGDSGEDVARLQDALHAHGLAVTDAHGVFGASTGQALASLYRAAGYKAPFASLWNAVALRSELVFAPNGALGSVVAIGASLGQPVVQPAITLTTSPAIVSAEMNQLESARLSVGDAASVTGTALGGTVEAKVAAIGTLAKSETEGFTVSVLIALETVLEPGALNSQVQIVIDTEPNAVSGLIVPLAALHSSADGGTSVIVVAGGKQTRVTVEVAETGGGLARVVAVGGELAVGSSVLVGSTA